MAQGSDRLRAAFAESVRVKQATAEQCGDAIEQAATHLIDCFRAGGKALVFGNGGSASDAQHIASEWVGRYVDDRPALPAIALTANSSEYTAIGNDYGFDHTFTRGIEAHGRAGDIAIGLSTSGNSPNVVAALEAARERELVTLALLGKGGGKLAARVDCAIVVPSDDTPRIQEAHITIGHVLCELIEVALFSRDRREELVVSRPIDRSKVKTIPARKRHSKVKVADEAVPHRVGSSFSGFLESLPDILGARDLREVIDAWARAWGGGRTVLFGFGAHLIKVGLAPVVVDLIERGAITGLFMNGAGCVHDLELAMMGRTSEEVGEALDDGTFGMARETGAHLNDAINGAAADGIGMGEGIGRAILDGKFAHKDRSVLACAVKHGIPATVHVAIGSDIHHMHPGADGAALGATSFRDFETLAGVVAGLDRGVVFNVGSAVILPEVFLKALSLARNLGNPVKRMTAVNLDFIRHYRPQVNVVERPTRLGGKGYALVGQHEVLVPLLAAGVIEAQAQGARIKGKGARKR